MQLAAKIPLQLPNLDIWSEYSYLVFDIGATWLLCVCAFHRSAPALTLSSTTELSSASKPTRSLVKLPTMPHVVQRYFSARVIFSYRCSLTTE